MMPSPKSVRVSLIEVQYQVGANASTISCAGDDLLRELTYRSVHELQVYVETKAMPTKVWQFDGPSTYGDLTLTYDGTAPDGNQTTHEAFDLAATDSFLFIGYSGRLTSFIPSWV